MYGRVERCNENIWQIWLLLLLLLLVTVLAGGSGPAVCSGNSAPPSVGSTLWFCITVISTACTCLLRHKPLAEISHCLLVQVSPTGQRSKVTSWSSAFFIGWWGQRLEIVLRGAAVPEVLWSKNEKKRSSACRPDCRAAKTSLWGSFKKNKKNRTSLTSEI